MKRLIVAVGGYGAGKTTFAKWYAKKHDGMFLNSELLYEGDLGVYLERLVTTVKQSPEELFVVDGPNVLIPSWDECEVRVCLCFAAPHVVYARQSAKALHARYPLPDSEEVIKLNTYHHFNMIANESDPLFVDTTDGFHFVTKEDFSQRWEELIFCSNLRKMSHDKYYGDVELPSGVMVSGYTQSYKTWDRLKCLVDFEGKDVLDLGCFHGYFSFKAEESGARSVTGIESDESTLEVAKQVAALKRSRVHFCRGDINNFGANRVYDIVLVLNVLHHIENVNYALKNIFGSGRQVVFEIPTSQKDVVDRFARYYGFKLVSRANSHREGREIMVYSSSDVVSTPLPVQYRYNYKVARLKKLPREVLASLVWRLEVYQPFKWLMRKYRSTRESRAKRLTYSNVVPH